jgi:pectin methylesterase-like acyl-CoA thioesterase
MEFQEAGPRTPPEAILREPPSNPKGGRTLIVDAGDADAYSRPSAALKEAQADDQVFIRPGRYEDKIFITERPILLIGAGRDHVTIFIPR